MKNTIFTSLILLLSLVVFAQDQNVTKTFSNIKSIRLSASSGDITLKKSSGKDVKVSVTYSYDTDEYEPLLTESEGRLTLEEKFSRGNHTGNSKWVIEMPDDLSVKVTTGSGDISVTGLKVDLKSNAGSGDVTLSAVKGDLDFNSGSGDMEIEDSEGEIKTNTGSGNIRASNTKGSLSFNAGSGNIKIDKLNGDIKVNTGSGDIDVKGVTLTGASSFNSGSGNTNVALASGLNFDISLNSGSGNSTLHFNGNPISGEVIMTANKRSGNINAPFKFDKEETISDNNSQDRIRKTAKLGDKDIQIKIGTGSGTAEIVK
jgi:hypothetical protein